MRLDQTMGKLVKIPGECIGLVRFDPQFNVDALAIILGPELSTVALNETVDQIRMLKITITIKRNTGDVGTLLDLR